MSSQYMHEPITTGKVVLNTTAGDIECELWCKECPMTCRNFIQLCLEGYYNGAPFHRLVKNFIIQGGDPSGTGQGGESIYGKPFKDEFHQRLTFNRRGLLGMANSGKDSNGSQFFFTLGTEPAHVRELTRKHTLFGKVIPPTIFNMLKMEDCEVDANERPHTVYKITGAKVITHPFDDIKPRAKERRKKSEKKVEKVVETKKLNLLSFGDEADEDELEIQEINKKIKAKGKSAHDVLNDEKLSKQAAVSKHELADYNKDEDEREDVDINQLREKLKAKKRRHEEMGGKDEDVDLETLIEEERELEKRKKMEEMTSELKKMQKEYVKALRGPKKNDDEDKTEHLSEALAEYKAMRMKFKSKSKKLKSKRDSTREDQTMKMLERFKSKLNAAERTDILFDKEIKADLPQKMTLEEDAEEAQTSQNADDDEGDEKKPEFGFDLDAEDTEGTDWMNHEFVAEDEIDPNVTRAKDANMRDEAPDTWYDISDPRHPINMRRRGEI